MDSTSISRSRMSCFVHDPGWLALIVEAIDSGNTVIICLIDNNSIVAERDRGQELIVEFNPIRGGRILGACAVDVIPGDIAFGTARPEKRDRPIRGRKRYRIRGGRWKSINGREGDGLAVRALDQSVRALRKSA